VATQREAGSAAIGRFTDEDRRAMVDRQRNNWLSPGCPVRVKRGYLAGEVGVVVQEQCSESAYVTVFLPRFRAHVCALPKDLGRAPGTPKLRKTKSLDSSATRLRIAVDILQARGQEYTVARALAEAVSLFLDSVNIDESTLGVVD
jgi:hypothetical protein